MDNSPRLYTKFAIAIFSTFGSTFFGSILFSINLKETNNGKFIAPSIIFSIIYTVLAIRLTLSLNIPNYYSFIPVHLIGGLFLVGPFWKYQIGVIEHFEKRKIWGPAIALIIPLALYLLFVLYFIQHDSDSNQNRLTASEFQRATQAELDKAIENATFVSQDSTYSFYDLNLPLLGYSYLFTTKVEDVNTVYNYIDYEEGRLTTFCMRIPLKEKEVFDFTIFGRDYLLSPQKCSNKAFKSIICADYIKTINDTLSAKGTIALIKINRIGYHFTTQYIELDKAAADSVSYSLITNITADSLSQTARERGDH